MKSVKQKSGLKYPATKPYHTASAKRYRGSDHSAAKAGSFIPPLLRGGGVVSLAKGYDVVNPRQEKMRREATIETTGEDKQLPAAKRLRITNLLRDMLRNSPAFVMQNRQMCINVVGTTGGKMYASFPKGYGEASKEVMDYFNKVWAPRAEFTYGRSFNWLLKTALTTKDVCGNVILVFDDGILSGGSGTGMIRAFEGDEIADVPDVSKFFPASFTQSQGFVYNALGQFAGAFVSTSQRGKSTFDPKLGVLKLRRDPLSDSPGNWCCVGEMFRFNQGRSVSPLASALISLIDLHETVSNEALAAKFNAQLIAQIVHTGAEPDAPPPSAGGFDGEAAAPGSGSGEGEGETVEVPQNEDLKNIGLRAQDMPFGRKLELIDTKRPNPNMSGYVDFVTGLIGGARGLGRVYSTLKAQTSYTAFRGEQIMTWQSFRDMQKDLEREVCDWAARCAIARAVRLGLIRCELPEGWERMIAWTWPRMIEVSEKDAQDGISKKLANGLTSLQREMTPGEFDRIMEERIEEKRRFDKAGLIYPGEESVSGAIKGDEKVKDRGEGEQVGRDAPIAPNDESSTDEGDTDNEE